MSRWLMWHPESECLFEETDPEAVISHLDNGCEDVSGVGDYETRSHEFTQAKHLVSLQKRAAGQQKVFKQVLLGDQRYPSCLNCVNWINNKCFEFKVLPPPEVIVFSCLTHWDPDIPF